MSYFANVKFSDDTITKSASGALRVAQLTTLHDGKLLGQDDVEIFSNAGTGTGAFSNNKFPMSVTSGQYYIKQTTHFMPYFSGKPQVVEHTFDGLISEANVVKEVGYYSTSAVAPYNTAYDGFWLEDDGTTKRIKASRFGTETVNVPFTSWDNYALLSSMNWTNFQVMFWDFLWLGGAALRLWVATPSGFVLAHSVPYVGNFADTIIGSPNQPVRYSIRSSTGTGSLRYTCSQVATEGSTDESGKNISVRHLPASPIACNTVGTQYVLLAVRKLASFRDTAIKVNSMSCINVGTSDNGVLSLIKNPTITGGTLTYATSSSGRFQYARNTTPAIIITPDTGRELFSIPISASGNSMDIGLDYLSYLSSQINDTMDVFALVYSPVTATQSVVGILNMKEY